MMTTQSILAQGQRRQPVLGGEIWLVGAGPGDAELLTLKALRAIQQADVVVYDRLVSAEIMDLVPEQALCIDVGKTRGCHRLSQEKINQLLVELAQAGQRVIRLKGGDPFIFGRGGEEMNYAQQAGIVCHVVPGITAATGCAAAVGLPLTHRACAQSVRFVTGHSCDGEPQLDWPTLADSQQTLVFYMGLSHSSRLCQRLIEHGLSAQTPVAIIERGTQPDQRLLTATLATLPALLARYQPQSPSLLVVGDVVRFCRHPALGVDAIPARLTMEKDEAA
ncbi:uroporphyrinogen-III C-methyltransferase [Pectobacterium parmentieri]|uniref:uroporphyrinogen-III C-methyltransferase n=2 Tax=Pectobacterium parmentieri TaxID=1905730 RepID=A0ABS0S0N1_PECPM|nr:uroporphyrinogen-III C-methyltransferase [Pectobacterium parmentieri]AYH00793.1 uroporphyrinogen-III C-methyltransferase [Pectobacterium parmentieri]AYH05256.1 uroporphyrinogen-III C-methyltransferase [Pectobacterium parmentieri]AYH14078.1 uroporphyrinogen-III C-methyltransferase [Pectobacterium parmentieri]AYH22782.1 uroporphyrinogen-III C-methyltransferase [Pectobacterium parmentieri]AYH27030.1 uroporphyrinogen-III C-methyltransferase [Pectobacterium parmentieri]